MEDEVKVVATRSEYTIEREFLGKITSEELIYKIILSKLKERK
jgi:hypothetical protein